MERTYRILISVLCVAGTLLAAGCASAAKADPAQHFQAEEESGDGAWIGLFTMKGPEDMAETLSLEHNLGRRFATLMWFTDFDDAGSDGQRSFQWIWNGNS